jgi:hypothetical protein
MQAAKDSFYMAMSTRLAALDASCTAVLGGAQRAAVAVCENERIELGGKLEGVFWLRWGAAQPLFADHASAYFAMELTVEYGSSGTAAENGMDRGRKLAAFDEKLVALLQPQSTALMDYTQSPAAALGGVIFWGLPRFDEPRQEGAVCWHSAAVKVYFHPEAE